MIQASVVAVAMLCGVGADAEVKLAPALVSAATVTAVTWVALAAMVAAVAVLALAV